METGCINSMNRMRLDKYLANSGIGTRKNVKTMIRKAQVTVDGEVIKDPGFSVTPDKMEIMADGQIIHYQQYYYLMMNKPGGVVSATTDNVHNTVIDLIPDFYKPFRLFPVGRLDIDAEGLLLLSNDGKLAHKLLSPRRHVPKTYYAIIEGEVASRDAEQFRTGVRLSDDFVSLPAELVILESGVQSKIELTIYEGKFHQVKR